MIELRRKLQIQVDRDMGPSLSSPIGSLQERRIRRRRQDHSDNRAVVLSRARHGSKQQSQTRAAMTKALDKHLVANYHYTKDIVLFFMLLVLWGSAIVIGWTATSADCHVAVDENTSAKHSNDNRSNQRNSLIADVVEAEVQGGNVIFDSTRLHANMITSPSIKITTHYNLTNNNNRKRMNTSSEGNGNEQSIINRFQNTENAIPFEEVEAIEKRLAHDDHEHSSQQVTASLENDSPHNNATSSLANIRKRRFSLWPTTTRPARRQTRGSLTAARRQLINDNPDDQLAFLLENDSLANTNNHNRNHIEGHDDNSISKTHIVALSDQWIELQCPLARELPNTNNANNPNANANSHLAINNISQQVTDSSFSSSSSSLSHSIGVHHSSNNPLLSSSSSTTSSQAHPSMAIVWRKNGESVTPSRRIKINSSNGSLIITGAQPKVDEGSYICALVSNLDTNTDKAGNGRNSANNDDNNQQASSTTNLSKSSHIVGRWKSLKAHQFELNLVEPPRLAPFEFPTDATVGMRVLVSCSILRGQKPISFVWLKDNQIIATHPNVEQTVSSNGGLSLGQLHRQQLAESRHQLSTTLVGASGSKKTNLLKGLEDNLEPSKMRLDYVIYNAADSPNQQHQQFLINQAAQGMRQSFKQSISGAGSQHQIDPSSALGENQLLAQLTDPSIRIRNSDDYSILSIEGLELKHSGLYTCSAHNEAARASHSSQLIINAAPSFVSEPKDVDLVSGQTARIDCSVTGQPKPTISWHRARETGAQQWDYVPIYDNLRYTSFPNGSLQIANVSQREMGYFLCSARNGFDPELTKLIRLTVHEPAKFVSRFKTQEARLEERVVLLCAPSGEPPIKLEWLDRDGKPIESSASPENKFLLEHEPESSNSSAASTSASKLILIKTNRSDSGHYTCQATNKYGSDKMIINLLVQHVPDKVTDLNVTNVTATTISLRWQPPVNSGNSPITSYLVQYQSDDPLDDLLSTTSLSTTASGLSLSTNNNPNNNNNDPGGQSTVGDQDQNKQKSGQFTGDNLKLRNEMQSFLRSTLGAMSAISATSSYDQSSSDEAIDRTLVELTVEQATSHLVVKDVAPSCLYRIRLAPINKFGLGQFSEWIRAKSEDAPPSASAQKISALATGPNSVKLSWLPPDRRAWNGPLIGFNIAYRPIDSAFELNKTFEWSAPSLQALIRSVDDTNHQHQIYHHPSALNLNSHRVIQGDGSLSSSINNNAGDSSNQQQLAGTVNKNSSSSSSNYYLVKQHLRQLLALQQQELVAHLTNLQRSTTYLVWLQAINSRGLSPQSHAISIKTLDDVPPSAPSIKIQSTSSSSITLTWSLLNNFISPANQYSLFYRKLHGNINSQPATSINADQNQYNGNSTGSMMSQSSLLDSQHDNTIGNYPFIERTITSHQLIMAGNLFLGADQDHGQQLMTSQMLQTHQAIGSINQHHQINQLQTQHYQQFVYTLDQLDCGSVYELYMSTRNSVGKSEPSAIVTTRTTGEPPLAPANKNNLFTRIGFNDVLLNLASWSNGGCPLTYMSIVYKPSPIPVAAAVITNNKHQTTADGATRSNFNGGSTSQMAANMTPIAPVASKIQVAPILLATLNGVDQPALKQQPMLANQASPAMLHSPVYNLKNLHPNSCYELEIIAHNQAGHTKAIYEFVTSHPNDTRSGFSRKEGIFRIDQRGTLIDSLVNGDNQLNTNFNNNYHHQKTFADTGYSTTMHLPIGQQLEPHQLAPLIFLVLCLICLLVSSTFCYYRFRYSWKFSGANAGNRRNHNHHINNQLARPSSADTGTNIDSGSSSGCHHIGGHPSSTICQSSPLSIGGKSSMWRMNANFANTLKHQRHHDSIEPGSPIHYCSRDPALGHNDHPNNHQATASLLANTSNPVNSTSFAQSMSMRDFNLITGTNNAQMTTIKNHNQNQHHHQHATTLNLKHYRSGLNSDCNNNGGIDHRISTLRTRLVSTTPYDNLIHPPHHNHHQHPVNTTFSSNSNNLNNIESEIYPTRLIMAPGGSLPSAAIIAPSDQQHQGDQHQPDYGYNIPLSSREPDINYNNIPLDGQHLAETTWSTVPGAITNYAIPCSGQNTLTNGLNSLELSTINNQGPNFDLNPQDHCQLDSNQQTQANISVCIQQLLNQEYQQQQDQYHSVVQSNLQHRQQQSRILDHQDPMDSILQQDQQHNQQQHDQYPSKGKTMTTNSVLGSSSGSSSSGIDLGQQSDVGSTSTANSANNHINHNNNNTTLNVQPNI